MRSNTNTFYSGWVFKLIIINVICYMFQMVTEQYTIVYSYAGLQGTSSVMTFYLGLIPGLVVEKGFVWQIFSYMFLHSTASFTHIFFNMYALLLFGAAIEEQWGSKKFTLYYLFCGAFAGICIFLLNYFTKDAGYYFPTIGASGAVYGLLLAFGLLYPDAELLIFFVLPLKAKYLVFLYGGLELFLQMSGGQSGISHIGHLGGLLGGLIFFTIQKRRTITFQARYIKSKLEKGLNTRDSLHEERSKKMNVENLEQKINLLKKLKTTGINSLTDDEFQYIKHLTIMIDDDKKNICADHDFSFEDDHCKNCEFFDACFIREVKKYL